MIFLDAVFTLLFSATSLKKRDSYSYCAHMRSFKVQFYWRARLAL